MTTEKLMAALLACDPLVLNGLRASARGSRDADLKKKQAPTKVAMKEAFREAFEQRDNFRFYLLGVLHSQGIDPYFDVVSELLQTLERHFFPEGEL